MAMEANSIRRSFYPATLSCKPLNVVPDANITSKKRSTTDLESQSQAMRLRKLGTLDIGDLGDSVLYRNLFISRVDSWLGIAPGLPVIHQRSRASASVYLT
jgi:hypothetical protein